jgi:hypothetical protein
MLSFDLTREFEREWLKRNRPPRDTPDWRILQEIEHEPLSVNLQKYLERPDFKVPAEVTVVDEGADHLHRIM